MCVCVSVCTWGHTPAWRLESSREQKDSLYALSGVCSGVIITYRRWLFLLCGSKGGVRRGWLSAKCFSKPLWGSQGGGEKVPRIWWLGTVI